MFGLGGGERRAGPFRNLAVSQLRHKNDAQSRELLTGVAADGDRQDAVRPIFGDFVFGELDQDLASPVFGMRKTRQYFAFRIAKCVTIVIDIEIEARHVVRTIRAAM